MAAEISGAIASPAEIQDSIAPIDLRVGSLLVCARWVTIISVPAAYHRNRLVRTLSDRTLCRSRQVACGMADIAKNILVEVPVVRNSRQSDPVVSADVWARIARSVAESKSQSALVIGTT